MKVFINKHIPDAGIKLLKEADLEIFIPETSSISKEEWISYCQNCDVLLNVGHPSLDNDFFDLCPDLKAIALFSVGFDHVDLEAATARNIPVGNTPEVLSLATSDAAFLLMQSVARRASFNFARVKENNWGESEPEADLGQELYNKTLGVMGLGRIGYEMARKCKAAFDMDIIYHNRNRNEELEEKLDARYVSFEELLSESDVLSIHANYTDEQLNQFDSKVFKQMKPTSILINTARGGFIKEDDLYDAIVNKEIWGAGLDVTNPEPMSAESPLLNLSKVCILPHIGSATIEARNGMARCAAENIVAFSKGEKMPYIVNDEVYNR